ncbi:MAG TPA: hypothetical protein VLA51_05530 [Paracoccaceae bacterium]|nr:hypothetical protein [Paracoccaceae bacterium]
MTAIAILPTFWTGIATFLERFLTQPKATADSAEVFTDLDARRDFIRKKLYENHNAFATDSDVSALMQLFPDRF